MKNKLIYELSRSGKRTYIPIKKDPSLKTSKELLPEEVLRKEKAYLPEVSELDVVRHYTNLSQLNMSVDTNFYPLGSCTMKYNPKISEYVTLNSQFKDIHPYYPEKFSQGALEILYKTANYLEKISGMNKVTFQPAAGAHGELTSLLVIRAYHTLKGNPRKKVIVPDSAHGTNPASSALAGYEVVEVRSNKRGMVDCEHLRELMDEDVAAIMLTNPNTLGIFEENIKKIADIAHEYGALLHYDGANLNAILGRVRPGDMGFDTIQFNLHKTFATPHGGGGPGSGPVGVKAHLIDFLPVPQIEKNNEGKYFLNYDYPHSIGKVRAFYGNFLVVLKAYVYLRILGESGIFETSDAAVLNANYLLSLIRDYFDVQYDERYMHEFVISTKRYKNKGIKALDVAKRLIDYGFHPPTIYFPLIVKEDLMIEPTETEDRETIEKFADALKEIVREIEDNPDILKDAPHTTPVKRLDEVWAARNLILRYEKKD